MAEEICNSVSMTVKLPLAFFSNSLGKVLQGHLCLVGYQELNRRHQVFLFQIYGWSFEVYLTVQTNLNILEVLLCVYSNVNEQ